MYSLFFCLLEEGNEKWPYFLHNFKEEKIASGIQFASSDDSGCNNRHSGHTRLSKFGRLPIALKQTEAKVGLSAFYTAQKNIFRNQSNLRRFTQ